MADSGVKPEWGIPLYRGILQELLSLYERMVPRPPHATVREYARILPLNGEQGSFKALTKAFEEARYGEREPQMSKDEMTKLGKRFFSRRRK
ncbi:hypothetical protein CULT_950013 [[Clostridium] ultunense Esp]|nr:hypothetical protein CULT_950013 [[Clostridium] ultunense Esp]